MANHKPIHPSLGQSNEPIRMLSILIPVFNEEKNIERILSLLDSIAWPVKTEWILIEDGSTDKSLSVIQKCLKIYPQARLFVHKHNIGKSSAIYKGIEMAKGEIIVIQDADLEYNPADILKLIVPLMKNEADVVYGSRYLGRKKEYSFHTSINKFLTFLSNLFSGLKLTDMETCYKVFRSSLLKSYRIRTLRFGFEPEITSYIAKFDVRVKELPVSYTPRNYRQGKKIGWKDGLAALWFIFKFNFMISREDCLKEIPQEELPKTSIAS